MSREPEFTYDVAFSFLGQDEERATRLNELLRDRLSTFIYSERQKELAGTDGEEAFARIFGAEARTVVVLYRNGWGESRWTRIEQTAIRNRAIEEGYDFTLFIPVERGATVPRWLPKAQIWFNRERWGDEAAAAVIAAHAQRAGGSEHEESIADRAARLARDVEADRQWEAFLFSFEGVKAADDEVGGLFEVVRELAAAISTPTLTFKFQLADPGRVAAIWGPHATLTFRWVRYYANSLGDSALTVSIWKGAAPIGNRFFREEPKTLEDLEYKFARSRGGEMGWRETFGTNRFLTSRRLAEDAVKRFLRTVEKLEQERE